MFASNLLRVGRLTMKLGTLMYNDESSSKHKITKQQTASDGQERRNPVHVDGQERSIVKPVSLVNVEVLDFTQCCRN